jgi:hypothetical protein
MAKKKQGIIDRLMLGKEKSEGYARAQLPSNRWELFWDIVKGRLGKLVIVNLLMLLFFLPLIGLLFVRYIFVAGYGAQYPFTQGFGVGYTLPPTLVGYAENIAFNVNLVTFIFLPIVALIAAVGISGGAYVIRNMVWTEGIFVANDFWRGIKLNFKQVAFIACLFSFVFYFVVLSISMSEYTLATGAPNAWVYTVSKILSYVVLIMSIMIAFHMLSMCVTYDLKIKQLLRNGALFTIGLFPQTVFFLVLGFLPFLFLTFGSFFASLGLILIILIAFSLLLLVWTVFSQWAFDKFINDKVPGAQKNRGIYEKIKESDSESLKKYREQIALAGVSKFASKPIKPITDDDVKIAELPSSFNRSDILKLNESKVAMAEDHLRYVEEHKNDPEFQPQEEDIAFEKEREEREKRIEKAKKELAKRNRNK